MKVPFILHVALYIKLLPYAVARWRGTLADAPRRRTIEWALILSFSDVFAKLWVRLVDPTNNFLASHLTTPLQGTFVLLALSEWQVQPLARSTMRYCIPFVWLFWAGAMFWIEDPRNFSVIVRPTIALVALAGALFAIIAHTRVDRDPVLTSPWAWALTGMAIYHANNAALGIFQAVVTRSGDIPMMVRTSILRGWLETIAFLILSGAFFWQTPSRSSGASSSPVLSR